MDELKLRVSEDGSELPLYGGQLALVRDGSGLHVAGDGQDALMRLRTDRRGVWMEIPGGVADVHVNGRRIRRMAMLRPGDAIYLEGRELVLVGGRAIAQPDDGALAVGIAGPLTPMEADLRAVVRGVGGKHHGRCFTLEQPRLVGSADDADIRIDDPAFPERHAQLSQIAGRIVLRDLSGSGEGSVVNGQAVRDAVLETADQLVFDGRHRFVVEAPAQTGTPPPALDPPAEDPEGGGAARSWRRWPWLLVAALLVATALAGLLLFGAGR